MQLDDSETANRDGVGKSLLVFGWQDQDEQVADLEPQCSILVQQSV